MNWIQRFDVRTLFVALLAAGFLFSLTEMLGQNPPATGTKGGTKPAKKTGTKGTKSRAPASDKASDKPDDTKPTTAADKAADKPQAAETAADKAGKPAGDTPWAGVFCRAVFLGPVGQRADLYEKQLDKAGGVTVKAVGDSALMLCGDAVNLDVMERFVRSFSGAGEIDEHLHQGHVVRLFYFRQAGAIAGAITEAGGLRTPVKAVGDDLLVFPSESEADDKAIGELKRWIALLDVPRPELSISAWSVQISSKNQKAIIEDAAAVREVVSVYNQKLHDAVRQGWSFLQEERAAKKDLFDDKFRDYLTKRYAFEAPQSTLDPPLAFPEPKCPAGQYCLGYYNLFEPAEPSLTSLIIFLLATRDGYTHEDAGKLVDCMESRAGCASAISTSNRAETNYGQGDTSDKYPAAQSSEDNKKKVPLMEVPPVSGNDCELQDDRFIDENPRLGPAFSCLRNQFKESMVIDRRKALLRGTLADFLFHYKISEAYPQQFVPYYRAASAQALDNLFSPLIVAFNRDLAAYLRRLQSDLRVEKKSDRKVEYSSDGIVNVSVLSGQQATLDSATQSFFSMPPVLSAKDFADALKGGSDSGASSPAQSATNLIAANLTPLAAQAVLAGVEAVQSKTAQIGRNLNLKVTATTLTGASSADLDLQLDSGEQGKPQLLEEGKPGSDDNVSRVAEHNTKTRVRVDALELFQVSSFSARLSHGREVPLIPPFIELPFIGNLARLRLQPGTAFHQSFAIVSAVIVPTAADLANSIRFNSDVETDHLQRATWNAASEKPASPPDKPKGDPAAAGDGETKDSADVQVKRASDGSITVAIQAGCKTRACAPPKPPPRTAEDDKAPKDDKAKTEKDAKGKKETVYFWIVTHYREGVSIGGPFKQDLPVPEGMDQANPVLQISWSAPATALWFDLYRSESPERSDLKICQAPRCFAIKLNIQARTFNGRAVADPKSAPPESETTIFTKIRTLPDNILEYHKRQVYCLEREADPNFPKTEEIHCEKLSLPSTPVIQ